MRLAQMVSPRVPGHLRRSRSSDQERNANIVSNRLPCVRAYTQAIAMEKAITFRRC